MLQIVDGKDHRDAIFKELENEANVLKDRRPRKEVEKEKEGPSNNKQRKLALDFDQSDDEEEEFDSVKKEIESYRQEPMLAQEEDALLWWRNKKRQYPHLIRLVRYKNN